MAKNEEGAAAQELPVVGRPTWYGIKGREAPKPFTARISPDSHAIIESLMKRAQAYHDQLPKKGRAPLRAKGRVVELAIQLLDHELGGDSEKPDLSELKRPTAPKGGKA